MHEEGRGQHRLVVCDHLLGLQVYRALLRLHEPEAGHHRGQGLVLGRASERVFNRDPAQRRVQSPDHAQVRD